MIGDTNEEEYEEKQEEIAWMKIQILLNFLI
jgi:hypothetical protein